ncbi:anoctamin-5-like [Melitaea cinxia]|uniref:anoctamin-5-like n=1 Tax=Melitaea cinxia TaxID=113334 RepID=UPI001E271BD4|nr:anoctamin-5-like [Melitaea cinxia]
MDARKCNRFKTFREELMSKKFQFINEDDSLHKMKVVNEDSSNQNKASEVGVKIMKEGLENQEEEQAIEPQPTANTGMFRDNLRRIDIILVVEDNPSSIISNIAKHNYLTNIIKTGLEVEVESGLMPAHKKLTFIKIHASNKVLTEYGETFGVKRYFVDNRLNSISPKVTKFTKIFNFFKNDNEREWIKIIRKNYVTANYSYFVFRLIIYKILLHLPFGDRANYYGINRLLKRQIIVDAYALHDGPYFLLPNQTARGSNARQILYYSWTRVENIFKSQPLHLIHEYFGPTAANL